VKAELQTIGAADLKRICYATKMTTHEWQTDCFIRTSSCKAVQSNEVWKEDPQMVPAFFSKRHLAYFFHVGFYGSVEHLQFLIALEAWCTIQ